MRGMKLLFCSSVYESTTVGPSVYLGALSTYLSQNRHQKLNAYKILTEDVVSVASFIIRVAPKIKPPFTKLSMLVRSWIYYNELMSLKKTYDFTHLVVFDPILGFFPLMFLRSSHYKFVCFVNDDSNIFPSRQHSFSKKIVRFLYKYLQKLSIKRSHLIMVNSNYLKGKIVDVYQTSRAVVLYKGVDLKTFYFKPTKEINNSTVVKILFVKSNFVVGGLKFLLEALRQLDFQAELNIVGPSEGDIKYILQGYQDDLRFKVIVNKGVSRNQLAYYYHQSHIFCVPSLREALGVANLEALACGTPVVSTTAGGIPEATDNGRVAWLCEPGSVEGLKKAIMDCLNNPDQRFKKVREGRKWVESNFDIHKQCEKFIELLTECSD